MITCKRDSSAVCCKSKLMSECKHITKIIGMGTTPYGLLMSLD